MRSALVVITGILRGLTGDGPGRPRAGQPRPPAAAPAPTAAAGPGPAPGRAAAHAGTSVDGGRARRRARVSGAAAGAAERRPQHAVASRPPPRMHACRAVSRPSGLAHAARAAARRSRASESGAFSAERAPWPAAPRVTTAAVADAPQAAPRGERTCAGQRTRAAGDRRSAVGERGRRRRDDGEAAPRSPCPAATGRSTAAIPMGQATARTHAPYYGGGYYPPARVVLRPVAYLRLRGTLGLGYFYYDPFWWGSSGTATIHTATHTAAATMAAPIMVAATTEADTGAGTAVATTHRAAGRLRRDRASAPEGQAARRRGLRGRLLAGTVDDSTARSRSSTSTRDRTVSRSEGRGSQTLTFDVLIPRDETVTYRGELKRIQ